MKGVSGIILLNAVSVAAFGVQPQQLLTVGTALFSTPMRSKQNQPMEFNGNERPQQRAFGEELTVQNEGSQQELQQRLARLDSMERELNQRLEALSRTEKSVDSLSRTNTVGKRSAGRSNQSSRGIAPSSLGSRMKSINEIWEASSPSTVQGGSLRTWSYANPAVKRVFVLLKTDGRPLESDIELWQGPDNTPHKMKVYLEDGGTRTFSAFIDCPRSPNTISIRNTGHLEFPMYACVGPDEAAGDACLDVTDMMKPEVVQGGALRTYPFDPNVNSVAVVIRTDGRPLNARIELLQGPNNNKQVLELYTEDGLERPFMAIIQTPGSGNVVRVVNSAPIEFPMYTTVAAYELASDDAYYNDGIQVGKEW